MKMCQNVSAKILESGKNVVLRIVFENEKIAIEYCEKHDIFYENKVR